MRTSKEEMIKTRNQTADSEYNLTDNQIRLLLTKPEQKTGIIDIREFHYRTQNSLEEMGFIEFIDGQGCKLTHFGRSYILQYARSMKYDLISQRVEGGGWGTYYYPYTWQELDELIQIGIIVEENRKTNINRDIVAL